MTNNSPLLEKIAELYNWLDSQIKDNTDSPNRCDTCGKCCDFDSFDHHLFVTTPELMYLAENIGTENLQPMPSGTCPYNIEGKCTVYQYRFTGCRIFCCKDDSDFQSRLSESVLVKLKTICSEFNIGYLYRDLASALNDTTG